MLHKLGTCILYTTFIFSCATGCGNKSSESASTASSPKISGVVTAPGNVSTGGSIAAYKPGWADTMLAMVFGKHATAAFSGLYAVSGATINLIQIDTSGNQVGAVLATATTDSTGAYTLALPSTFTPSAEYVVRAVQGGASMDAVVANTDYDVDIDPVSDAARQLLTTNVTSAGATLASITPEAVSEMVDSVIQAARSTDLSNDLSGATLTNTTGYVAAVMDAVTKDEEAANAVASVAAATRICGNVTNAAGAAIAKILIVVRRYSDWVPQARTLTDSSGAYCLNVPAGDYIVGANNHKILGFAASEWFTSGGGDVKRKKAEKVTVSTGTLTKDFVLSPGGRIAGRVTAQDTGNAIPGVAVTARDWNTNSVTFSVKTDIYGYYRLNLPAGDYRVELQNNTLQAYASEYWNDSIDGGLTRGFAKKISVSTGAVNTANFDLLPGRPVYGVVQNGGGTILPGIPVDIRDTASFVTAASTRTNINGRFRVQLHKGLYSVVARGKTNSADTRATAAALTLNYAATAQPVTVTDTSGTPVPLGDVKVILRNATGGYISSDGTDSSGNATVYDAGTTLSSSTNKLVIRVDDGSVYESQVYSGIYNAVASGASIDTTAGASDSTKTVIAVTLAGNGATVSGRVTYVSGGTTYGAANATVMIYDGATTNLFDSLLADNEGYYSFTVHPGQSYSAKARLVANNAALTTATTPITVAAGANTLDIPMDVAMGPPMPLGVYAVQGAASSGTVTVNWKPVANITNFKIYASTMANTTPAGTPTASATGTSATLTLSSGTTYYIRVASVDPSDSAIISATYAQNEITIVAP